MLQSETIKTLLENLEKAQSEFPTLPKDTEGYNYKYTNLDTIISTLRPILSKHNIGFMQSMTAIDGKPAITTRLFNDQGEWIEDTPPIPAVVLSKGNAAQCLGAAITYMKRYTLCAFLGVSCDEDVDGNVDRIPEQRKQQNAPQKNNPQPQNKAPQQKAPAGGKDTPEQNKKIKELLATKDASGKEIFAEEKKKIGKWRMERTADQVISYLEEEKKKRLGDAFPEDIPYDESPLSPEEEAGANTAFDTSADPIF